MEARTDNNGFSKVPEYLFHQGTNYEAQKLLGVHREMDGERYSYVFRVWAPSAREIFLVGDFVGWDIGLPMHKTTGGGIWECCYKSDKSLEGEKYKFKVFSRSGVSYKADPYATLGETREKSASIIHTEGSFEWQDDVFLAKRMRIANDGRFYRAPLNVYEMHLGSWRKRNGEDMNYREIADELVPYLKRMGYTHAELLPITEYPYDGSWGYQCCGYFAPTSRFGSPEDFKYFVNKLHTNGIGVILDWVSAHFPKDEHGLFEFDGSPLYEYSAPDRREHPEWGTRMFNLSKNEVKCFLISGALWWLSEYHVDGIRVDAVSSMLYLDYGRAEGEWIPNIYGGNESLEAVAFFQRLNTEVFLRHPDVLMIAEESTSFPMVTKSVESGGLGFNFKWNMGWASDMYEYVAVDPFFRRGIHGKLTFSLCYAFSENYILPVSHDEVVHGKKSLLDKMFGSYEQKFSGTRLFMAYQIMHPGKKLTFMGCEYGQFREWDYNSELEWFMLGYEKHGQLSDFVSVLNNLYLSRPELWEEDFSWAGFKWIYPDLSELNVIAFSRYDSSGNELIGVFNFSGADINGFSLAVTDSFYKEILNTDSECFGGTGLVNEGELTAVCGEIKINLPALSAVILEPGKTNRNKESKDRERIRLKMKTPDSEALELSENER